MKKVYAINSYEIVGFVICGLLLGANIVITALVLNSFPGSELGVFGPNYFQKVYITPW